MIDAQTVNLSCFPSAHAAVIVRKTCLHAAHSLNAPDPNKLVASFKDATYLCTRQAAQLIVPLIAAGSAADLPACLACNYTDVTHDHFDWHFRIQESSDDDDQPQPPISAVRNLTIAEDPQLDWAQLAYDVLRKKRDYTECWKIARYSCICLPHLPHHICHITSHLPNLRHMPHLPHHIPSATSATSYPICHICHICHITRMPHLLCWTVVLWNGHDRG